MTDAELLALFQKQDEQAIAETNAKYGRLCRHIALELLGSKEDAEEIVNDVLMRAWNVLPQQQPEKLAPFLAAMTRNLSTNRLDHDTAKRRGGGQMPAVLDELAECMASAETVEQAVDAKMLDAALKQFLDALPQQQRAVFVLRYSLALPVQEIAAQTGLLESNIKVTLMRLRKKLNTYLAKEGFL